jgi:dGTPase
MVRKKLSKVLNRRPKGRSTQISRSDRRHGQDREPDQRNSFQRDRDRILYSPMFRRLAGVTQVVHAAEGHIFHNRLTHTLKVAQIGRRSAEYLISIESEELIEANGGIDPDVVETAALAHDLGHPPFGHIAETELDDRLDEKHISDGFEGNAQSFRVVTKIGRRLDKIAGLNLTRASLNAILKYPYERGPEGTKQHKKWGAYKSEIEDFNFARAGEPPGEPRRSAEAELMDWADDVTYSVHDVEDFYRAGIIPLDQILAGTQERDRFIDDCFRRWKEDEDTPEFRGITKNWGSQWFDQLRFFAETKKFNLLQPFAGTLTQLAGLDFLTAFLIKRFVVGPDRGTRAIRLESDPTKPRIRIQPQIRAEVEMLKKLMARYVFDNPALLAQQYGQRQVVGQLFEVLFKVAKPGTPGHGIIPEPFRELLNEVGVSDDRERARIVADIIASMTEQQALLFHQRVVGIAPGSVRDLIIA